MITLGTIFKIPNNAPSSKVVDLKDKEVIGHFRTTQVSWPGPEKDVFIWLMLADGYAVGYNQNEQDYNLGYVHKEANPLTSKRYEIVWNDDIERLVYASGLMSRLAAMGYVTEKIDKTAIVTVLEDPTLNGAAKCAFDSCLRIYKATAKPYEVL